MRGCADAAPYMDSGPAARGKKKKIHGLWASDAVLSGFHVYVETKRTRFPGANIEGGRLDPIISSTLGDALSLLKTPAKIGRRSHITPIATKYGRRWPALLALFWPNQANRPYWYGLAIRLHGDPFVI